MARRDRFHMRAAAAFGIALAACGCSGYNSNGQNYSAQSFTYLAGTFSAGTDSGALEMSVPVASLSHAGSPTAAMPSGSATALGPTTFVTPSSMAAASVTGNLRVSGGATSALTGTYTTGAGTLQANTASSTFTFSGALQGSAIAGTVTGPNGAGGFVAGRAAAGNSILVYCGTYAATGGTRTGKFNVVVLAPTSGLLLQTDDTTATPVFSGAVTLAMPAGQIAITLPGGASVYASGTTGTTSVTGGTFDDGNGGTGTWSATQCASYTVSNGGGVTGMY